MKKKKRRHGRKLNMPDMRQIMPTETWKERIKR
jgi:hypothetical protein